MYVCIRHIALYVYLCIHKYNIKSYFCSGSDWSEELHGVTPRQFVEPVGPSKILPPTVLGIFRLFFTTSLVGLIVRETNEYARLVLGERAQEKWTDVTEEDIWAFLGFALLMGINRLPQLHLYWNTNPAFHYLPIAERITRDRFMSIWRFLHFTSNTPSCTSSSPSGSICTQDRL